MLPAFLLSLREGLESALIVGIVLGALHKMKRPDLRPAVWAGVAAAVLVSLLVGGFLAVLGLSLDGQAEQIFEGLTMLLAAGVLTWMIFWMKRQSRTLRADLESSVQQAADSSTNRRALFALAFLAVAREGIELALFVSAAAFALQSNSMLPGALLGLAVAILLGWLLFSTTLRLDLRRFFQVTSILLILFAAGLVAYGVHELNEVGWIPSVIEHVWDLNPWLDENSILGSTLKVLFGYNGNPSLTETLAYLAYISLVGLGIWQENRNQTQLLPA